jgi:hypothetical protein
MDPTVISLVVVAVVLLVVVLALVIRLGRRSRSECLREHFGPEYERSVSRTGDREAAEAELIERQERRRELDIRDLRPEERTQFHESWATIPERLRRRPRPGVARRRHARRGDHAPARLPGRGLRPPR